MKAYSCCIILLLVVFSSCKKCITCQNHCVKCSGVPYIICDNEVGGTNIFNDFINSVEAGGGSCVEISSTVNERICDKPNRVKIYETAYKNQHIDCR